MKYPKIALAIILTIVMLHIARTNSCGQPDHITHSENGFTFEMTTVPKIIEYQTDLVTFSIDGSIPDGAVVWMRFDSPGSGNCCDLSKYSMAGTSRSTDDDSRFTAVAVAGPRGGRMYYYFEIANTDGNTLAGFTQDDGSPFVLKYIGEVPTSVLVGHIFLMFATVFCICMAAIYSLALINGGNKTRLMVVSLSSAAVVCFLGAYPFGIAMNYFAFGTYWEGVPFGTDATDNKTQLLFVYLLFAVLSCLGSLTGGKHGHDVVGTRALGWIGFGSFIVMLFIYLIPHSIQFSAALTYTFCYTWIGIVVLLYLIGRIRLGRTTGC